MRDIIKETKEKISKIKIALSLDEKVDEMKNLELQTSDQHFWDNPKEAQSIMQKINETKDKADIINSIETKLSEIEELDEMLEKDPDPQIELDIDKELADITQILGKFELEQFLSGKYDINNAIVSIHAGQGGTEANDWAEMLLRMYLRYAERQKWQTNIIHQVRGEEAGLSTVTFEVIGKFAYGYLKREKGTHRLVRLSPYNAQNLRQTSFAGVEVLPMMEEKDASDFVIPECDLEYKAVKATGPGGQHVNKASTAIVLTHKPTGITVHSSRRSQHQNRETALYILKSRLWELEEDKKDQERKKMKGEHKIAAWGNQIRNYVLHPYKLVKDLRTKVESNSPDSVLNGELDPFIDAGIRLVA
ncbi:peptide chain release factor 2 [Candidatus Dojkabacteria bacterium]|nr:peptide chain release factor 2 [Candidatus Dojkabacteria bacterium]